MGCATEMHGAHNPLRPPTPGNTVLDPGARIARCRLTICVKTPRAEAERLSDRSDCPDAGDHPGEARPVLVRAYRGRSSLFAFSCASANNERGCFRARKQRQRS